VAKPLITIVTCTKNQGKYLPELLQSLAVQEEKNFEHVIIDGFSSDNTVSLLTKYKKENETAFPIHIHQFPPLGIADAMNKGILHSHGDWIIIIHGDDYLINEKATDVIEKAVKMNTQSEWIVANTTRKLWGIRYTTKTFLLKPILFRLLPVYNFLNHQNMIMRRDLFLKYGGFRTDFKINMDYEYYLRLLHHGVMPAAFDGEFSVFRRHESSASAMRENQATVVEEFIKLKRQYKNAVKWGKR
jgi:glycosyltransferase involved in cell wall biosynthesis